MGKSFMEEGQEYELAGFLNGWAGGVGVWRGGGGYVCGQGGGGGEKSFDMAMMDSVVVN